MASDTPHTPLLDQLPSSPQHVRISQPVIERNTTNESQASSWSFQTLPSFIATGVTGVRRFSLSVVEEATPEQPSQDHARHLRVIDSALTDLEEIILSSPDIDVQFHNEHVLRQTRRRLWLSQRLLPECLTSNSYFQKYCFESAWQGFVRWNRCHNKCKLPLMPRISVFIDRVFSRAARRISDSRALHEDFQVVYFRVIPPDEAAKQQLEKKPDEAAKQQSEKKEFPHEMPPLNFEILKVKISEDAKVYTLGETQFQIRAVQADRRGWKSYTVDNHMLTSRAQVYLSPEFLLTLPKEARYDAGIPEDATHFSFSYPVQKNYLKRDYKPNDDAIEDLLINGGFLYFKQLDRVKERTLREWSWQLDISRRFQLQGILSVSGPAPREDAKAAGRIRTIHFGSPLWLRPEDVTGVWLSKQAITLDFLRDLGARYFAWIAPQEKLASEECPMGYPYGGFLYWGTWKDLPMDTEKGKSARIENQRMYWAKHFEALEFALKQKEEVERLQHDQIVRELTDAFKSRASNEPDPMKRARLKLNAIQQARFGLKLETSKSRLMAAYFTLFSFRVPFSMLISLLVWISFVAGMQMELFFTVLGAIYDDDYVLPDSSVGFFIALPFLMVFSAVMVDRLWFLILDAFAPPHFVKFRAKALVVYQRMFGSVNESGKQESCQPSQRSCILLDLFMLFILEILPWGGFFYNLIGYTCLENHFLHLFFVGHEGLVQAISGGFMTGTLEMCILITLFISFVEVKYSSLEWHCNAGMSFEPEVRKAEEIAMKTKMLPYFTWYNYLAFDTAYKSLPETNGGQVNIGQYHRRNQKQDEDLTRGRVISGVSFGLWVAVSLLFAHVARAKWVSVKSHGSDIGSWLFLSGSLCLTFAIIGLSYKLKKDMPNLTSGSYWVFLILLMVLNSSMLYGGKMMGGQGSSSDDLKTLDPIMTVLTPGEAPFTDELPTSWQDTGQAQKYPICRMSWGSDDAPLSAIDLGALAWISYEPSENASHQMTELLKRSFGDRDPELLNTTDYNDIPRWMAVRFKAKSAGKKDTIAFAIKGTSTLKDGYLDTDLFTFIKALQFSSILVPVLHWMPKDLVQWGTFMIKMRFGFGGRNEARIWKDVKKEIKNLQEQYKGKADFVITGHSLGGALAEVAAAQCALPALQWSGPGTHFTERFFNVSEERMQRDVVSIVPDLDVVPRVDEHDSVVAHIQCHKKYGALASPLDCHSLKKSVCEVWRVCGDRQERDFGKSCSQWIAKNELGALYPERYTER